MIIAIKKPEKVNIFDINIDNGIFFANYGLTKIDLSALACCPQVKIYAKTLLKRK